MAVMLHCVDNDLEKGPRMLSASLQRTCNACSLGLLFHLRLLRKPWSMGVAYAQSFIARTGAATPVHDAPYLSPSNSSWILMVLGVCGAGGEAGILPG